MANKNNNTATKKEEDISLAGAVEMTEEEVQKALKELLKKKTKISNKEKAKGLFKNTDDKYILNLPKGKTDKSTFDMLNTKGDIKLDIPEGLYKIPLLRERATSVEEANDSLKKAGLDCKIKDVYEFNFEGKPKQFTVLYYDELHKKVVTVSHDKTTETGLRLYNFDKETFKEAGTKVAVNQVKKPIKIEFLNAEQMKQREQKQATKNNQKTADKN